MASENHRHHVTLSSNYSGGCEVKSLTNDDLLQLTDSNSIPINGRSLFALKYGVVPCTVNGYSQSIGGTSDMAFILNQSGVFSNLNRGRKWCSKRQQGGMYHATRFVISYSPIILWNFPLLCLVLSSFSSKNTKQIQIHSFLRETTTHMRINPSYPRSILI